MDSHQENLLANASSSYLRSARHQPVRWHEWGQAAFDKARNEGKPVLLDIGAVWCHWCHFMDRESYEDAETAALINDRYVAIKVDRDERPDVDTRYQAAVSTISGQAGWPLTAFLTSEGAPYFGGTYFPPEERYGRPSFQRVLATMADVFANKRDEVAESASSILEVLEQQETLVAPAESLDPAVVARMVSSTIAQFDSRNGGFGSQPKFPHSAAIDLLIEVASHSGANAAAAKEVATATLRSMARGGIYDHLAGGFHRYSVDEKWVVPHFEKMAYDNSELLKNYVHAFQSFLDPEFAATARDIIRWMDEWLSDREHGGFYASQDADASLEDDGDFYTWTRSEARAFLSEKEFAVAEAYFNLRDVGDMHHNAQKNVLHVRAAHAELAQRLSMDEAQFASLLCSAKDHMYAARLSRPMPLIDKTIYTGWNGMCISAYLQAARVLQITEARDFALKSLDRLLATTWSTQDGLCRVVTYADHTGTSERVPGVLDDYAFAANAAVDAWEMSGDLRYFSFAREIADAMLARFYDADGGGFFDTETRQDAMRIGVLNVRRKPLQDAPTPAGNSTAATVLLRLSELTGERNYRERAEETLRTFAGVVEQLGLYAASYGLALCRALKPAAQVCIVGDDKTALELLAATLTCSTGSTSVVQLRREQLTALPPSLAETLPNLMHVEGSFAVVCANGSCFPPVQDAEQLAAMLRSS